MISLSRTMKWVLLFCAFEAVVATDLLSDDEYYRMPPMVSLEPYERCFTDNDSVYCSGYVNYVSEEPNPLFHQMQEHSKETRRHFNHTRVFRGVCLSKNCNHLLHNSTAPELVLEACLNETEYQKYKLRVRLDDKLKVSCTKKDKRRHIDNVDIAVGIVCIAIVVLNIVGSLCDDSDPRVTHYRFMKQIALCFSIPRNWKRLTNSDEFDDPRLVKLKGLHGIRAISTTLVVMAHSIIPVIILINDARFLENTYSKLVVHILMNGTLIMQTFLIISAFLLIYNLQIIAEKQDITWRLLPVIMIKRWFRITPPFALVLAFSATWQRHIAKGPVWQIAVEQESADCRRVWWSNIFYFNNYIESSHCMIQSWYLAADTQLYTVGVLVFLMGRRYPVKKVLGAVFALGLAIPALHTYFEDLDGSLLITPTTIVNFFITDPTFIKIYQRGHTNLAGYAVGLALGYLVYHLQTKHTHHHQYKKWRYVYWSLFPLGVCLVLANKVFYSGERRGALTQVAAATLMKPLFAATVAAIMLGIFTQIETVYGGVAAWGGWRALSRVSYSAYLLHVAVVRVWTGLYAHTITTSYQRATELVTFLIVGTYLGAFLFWLTVEAPLSQITKICLEPGPKEKKID